MIKKLRYVTLSLMAMLCGSLYAQTVTIDFSGEDRWGIGTTNVVEAKSYTYDGYTIKLTPTAGNYFRWYTSGNILLGKQGATLELPPFDFDVERIDIEGTSGASAAVKQNFFVGDEAISTETTGAKDVTNEYKIAEDKQAAGTVYTLKVTSNHNTQITKIMIYKKGEGGGNAGDNDDPELPAGGTETEPWSVAEALAACANLGADEYVNDGAEVYVAGVITKIDEISTSFGNATYYISDDVEGSNSLEVYRGYSLNGDKFTSATEIEVGDSVIVCGKIVNFRGNTLEFTTGSKLVSLKKGEGNGNAGDEPTEPGETGTIDNPLTPSQAYDLVSAMPADQTSTADYYVKGKICSIKYTFSAQYGTATFNISDDGNASDKEFIAYSCLYFNSQKWQEGDTQINVGDEVIVCGKVINYYGNTPEFASQKNCLVSLNGTTTAINGTKTSAQSGQAYNMAGQKVSDNYRGLVVKNGKKVMMK